MLAAGCRICMCTATDSKGCQQSFAKAGVGVQVLHRRGVNVHSLSELMQSEAVEAVPPAALKPGDVATIIHTSGCTGNPKAGAEPFPAIACQTLRQSRTATGSCVQGIVITHSNILAAVQGMLRRAAADGLPLTEIHVYMRQASLLALLSDCDGCWRDCAGVCAQLSAPRPEL